MVGWVQFRHFPLYFQKYRRSITPKIRCPGKAFTTTEKMDGGSDESFPPPYHNGESDHYNILFANNETCMWMSYHSQQQMKTYCSLIYWEMATSNCVTLPLVRSFFIIIIWWVYYSSICYSSIKSKRFCLRICWTRCKYNSKSDSSVTYSKEKYTITVIVLEKVIYGAVA